MASSRTSGPHPAADPAQRSARADHPPASLTSLPEHVPSATFDEQKARVSVSADRWVPSGATVASGRRRRLGLDPEPDPYGPGRLGGQGAPPTMLRFRVIPVGEAGRAPGNSIAASGEPTEMGRYALSAPPVSAGLGPGPAERYRAVEAQEFDAGYRAPEQCPPTATENSAEQVGLTGGKA